MSRMFPRWTDEEKDARFAAIRRKQNIEQARLTPAERLARASELVAFARAAAERREVSAAGTDESLELWRAIRARLRR